VAVAKGTNTEFNVDFAILNVVYSFLLLSSKDITYQSYK